jgi:hypothetical protein
MEKDAKKNPADILQRKCLLRKFYVRAGILNETMEALRTAKHSAFPLSDSILLAKSIFPYSTHYLLALPQFGGTSTPLYKRTLTY